MGVISYASYGYEGALVTVEVDIRRGIPGVHIVGLPDNAVREAKERIRVACGNSGMQFPRDRVLINLAPADVKKEGTAFDLPIAIAVLIASGTLPPLVHDVMILGELQLSGRVRPVRGVLPAVAAGQSRGIRSFIVPSANTGETSILGQCRAEGVASLSEAAHTIRVGRREPPGERPQGATAPIPPPLLKPRNFEGDLSDIRGVQNVKRGLEIAAAGRHHVLLFGPPGGGKTMAAIRMPTILPDLSSAEAIELLKIKSIAGNLQRNEELSLSPPFRSPHHSSSLEGMVGGGTTIVPGEISLAHHGVLFLDEAPEFGKHLIQSLREPIETGRIILSRAGSKGWFPADFQLIIACNVCPCANLGRDDAICTCSKNEVTGYWRRLGGSLLDRIDIRIPVKPIDPSRVMDPPGESSDCVRERVITARQVQARRYADAPWSLNGSIPAAEIPSMLSLSDDVMAIFAHAARQLSLSTRATHSVLRVARTIADLRTSVEIGKDDVLEAFQLRRFGDADLFWQ